MLSSSKGKSVPSRSFHWGEASVLLPYPTMVCHKLPVLGTVSDNIYPIIFTRPVAVHTGVAGNVTVVLPTKYP